MLLLLFGPCALTPSLARSQEGHPQQARFAGGAGSLWKDHRKGVSGGAALLLEAGPDLPDLRCVWVVIPWSLGEENKADHVQN